MSNENNVAIVKGKIDPKLNDAFRQILNKLNISQQEFIEQKVKECVLENLNIVIVKDTKANANEK